MSKAQKNLVKQRNVKTIKRRLMIFLIALVVVIGGSAAYGGFLLGSRRTVKSEQPSADNKYYTSIEIKKGDSLWSIANSYMSEEYGSITEYINELKNINSLETDLINESGYLTVAYYL